MAQVWTVPLQRSASTAVLPYPASPSARRSRVLRAWMLTLPVDLAAFLLPLAWNRDYWKGMIAAGVVTVVTFALGGLYAGRRHVSFLDELPQLCVRLLAAAAVVAIIAAERHDSVDYVAGFMRVVALSAGLVLAGRLATRMTVLLARRRRWVEHGAIIVGGGPVAIELARLLRRYPEYGLHVVGFVDGRTDVGGLRVDGGSLRVDCGSLRVDGGSLRADAGGPRADGDGFADREPLLGGLGQIEEIVRQVRCEVVVIADVDCTDEELLRVARLPEVAACDLWVVPRLREFHARNGIPDHIGAIGVNRVTRPSLTGPQFAVKRAFDIAAAGISLVILSPVLLLCAIATRIEGGPGVLFRQVRVGRHGRLFELLKFRSMRPADETESQTTWSVAGDPRLGPVGRFLRRTSLDELPQLWNILRGDMTVVGPRPERPYFVDRFSLDYPEYAMRHRVPVGLTGLAQVSGLRGDTPISDRARFDNYYIENWSLWLDVKVILRTIMEVLRGGGR